MQWYFLGAGMYAAHLFWKWRMYRCIIHEAHFLVILKTIMKDFWVLRKWRACKINLKTTTCKMFSKKKMKKMNTLSWCDWFWSKLYKQLMIKCITPMIREQRSDLMWKSRWSGLKPSEYSEGAGEKICSEKKWDCFSPGESQTFLHINGATNMNENVLFLNHKSCAQGKYFFFLRKWETALVCTDTKLL